MASEPGKSSNQVFKLHTEAGSNPASNLVQEAKNDNNGLDQVMVSGLELHPVTKTGGSLPKLEATISDFEVHPGAKHQDDNTTTSHFELLSHAKNSNEKPMEENLSGGSYPLSASALSSSDSAKKRYSEEPGSFDDSFSELMSSEAGSLPLPDVSDSDQAQQWSMISVSPRSGGGNFSAEMLQAEWNMFGSSPMKPPLSQTMGRPAGYDPNRIPSSIFSARPTTPAEWSVASNESLFSIHMGNNSFSRDHVIMFGDTKPEDWYNSPLPANNVSELKSNESSNLTSNLPPVFESASEHEKKNIDIGQDSLPGEECPLSTQKIVTETSEECDKEKPAAGAHKGRLSVTSSNLSGRRSMSSLEGARQSVSGPRHSHESTNSCSSFAFPLLVEGGRCGSLKPVPETPVSEKPKEEAFAQPENQTEHTPKPDKSNCFSCITCWPRCCF